MVLNNKQIKALKNLNVRFGKIGVKVRSPITNRWTQITDLSMGRNRAAIEKTYGLVNRSLDFLEHTGLPDYVSKTIKRDTKDHQQLNKGLRGSKRAKQETIRESHTFNNITREKFYTKLESLLDKVAKEKKSFKCQIQLGYELINSEDGEEMDYFPTSETNMFKSPVAINERSDVRDKIINPFMSGDLDAFISRPTTKWRVNDINAFTVLITYRNHHLGEDVTVPKQISNNRHIINFKETKGKCVFYCIAKHLDGATLKDPRRIVPLVKQRFQQYCQAKGLKYTPKLYTEFKGVDIFLFEEIENIFKINIEVYEFDLQTESAYRIRDSKASYETTMDILDYEGHAMFITNTDQLMKRYKCGKCDMMFGTSERAHNHRKNNCQEEFMASFTKEPKAYRPPTGQMKKLLSKYKIEMDSYLDHFITFDFEAIVKKSANSLIDSKTVITGRHVPVSVSVADSLTNTVKCFVNDDPQQLMNDFIAYVEKVSKLIYRANFLKFRELFYAIDDSLKQDTVIDIYNADADDWANHYRNDIECSKDTKTLIRLLSQTPLVGFNNAKYDVNLIKNYLFNAIVVDDMNDINVIKMNNSYMCLSTSNFRMLDIRFYLPPDVNYEGYLKMYLGGCKCKNKVECVCCLTKGSFCYDYLDSFSKLSETSLPSKDLFFNKLKQEHISDDDYAHLEFVWRHYEMKTLKDFLVWYNNLDVLPFILAIQQQREFYRTYDLDMLIDCVSLPGLAERIGYQIAYGELPKIPAKYGKAFSFPEVRFAGYKQQDDVAISEANEKLAADLITKGKKLSGKTKSAVIATSERQTSMTINHLNDLLKKQFYSCTYCKCALTPENVSADRMDNKLGHINGNIIMSCIHCNCSRKDMSMNSFRYQKFTDYNSDKLIFQIDHEYSEIYHLMKRNIAGGPSIIFNRYAETDKTYLRQNPDKVVKKIIGYDANALYLWCIGNDMPCGRMTMYDAPPSIVEDIKADRIFGFLECDIETPEELKDHFSEMCPIFKNAEIDPCDESVVGKYTFDYNNSLGDQKYKSTSKKLISSYYGKRILLYTPLLKWYLEHGLIITKTYNFVQAEKHRPFSKFVDTVSDARRGGDVDINKKMFGEMMKLVGNSFFGRSGMDMTKHKATSYIHVDDEEKLTKEIESNQYEDFDQMPKTKLGDVYEMTKKKRRIKFNNPIHMSIAIYQLAKLRMLEFYYDCVDKYIPRADFQLQEMDTDSNYFSFSDSNPFINLIKPEMRAEFELDKYNWFPREDEHAKYDRRTPGLFKEEWRGNGIVSLSSKNYHCFSGDEGHPDVKTSSKGVQKRHNADILNEAGFKQVIEQKTCIEATNKGFRLCRQTQTMISYEQTKKGLNNMYNKRQLLADGISTRPLNL